jgi:hypothetical protein
MLLLVGGSVMLAACDGLTELDMAGICELTIVNVNSLRVIVIKIKASKDEVAKL